MKILFYLAWGVVLAIPSSVFGAESSLANGGFEAPEVNGRVASDSGGDPTKVPGDNVWSSLELKPPADEAGGRLTVGLTNEIARSGKQAFFVDFQKITATKVWASLGTKPLPIMGGKIYRTSIWCRVDLDRPIALDERRPIMWTNIGFLKADGKTPSGEPITSVQLIPGSSKPGQIRLFFTTHKWSELTGGFEAPSDAAFVEISWFWTIPNEEGETDGILYCDDVGLIPVADDELLKEPAAATPVETIAPTTAAPQ